jgi:hypothetical protein
MVSCWKGHNTNQRDKPQSTEKYLIKGSTSPHNKESTHTQLAAEH